MNACFPVTGDLMRMKTVVLVCEGLDTVGTVLVNGQVVGKSDNMFIRYTFDIKDQLKVCTNLVNVLLNILLGIKKNQEQDLCIDNDCIYTNTL